MHPRKYGHRHRMLRQVVNAQVQAGGVRCVRCTLPIEPGTPWDLGHRPGGAHDEYEGACHAECNRSTSGTSERPTPARALQPNQLSDDVLYTGREDVPEGTLSNNGQMVKRGGGWHAVWIDELL